MSAETQKVDFESVLRLAFNGATNIDEELLVLEARDALAELIAAGGPALNELRAYISDCESYEAPELVEELIATADRFEAALARIGGAA